MSQKFEDSIDHKLRIINEKIIGEVTIIEIINHRRQIVFSDDYNDSYNIIFDIREANITDFIKNQAVFTNFINEISAFRNMHRKCAFITSKPADVVNAEMAKLSLQKINSRVIVDIFSTESAAMAWLE